MYMVQRRERLKKRILNCQQELLDLEASLLSAEEDGGSTCVDGEVVEEEEEAQGGQEDKEEEDEDEMETQQSIRQTRYVIYMCIYTCTCVDSCAHTHKILVFIRVNSCVCVHTQI